MLHIQRIQHHGGNGVVAQGREVKPVLVPHLGIAELAERPHVRNDGVGQMPVYFGGPVQAERGFVLHEPGGNWNSTLRV